MISDLVKVLNHKYRGLYAKSVIQRVTKNLLILKLRI